MLFRSDGQRIDAAEALSIGLVNALAEPGELLARAEELARSIAANGPLAVRKTLQMVREAVDLTEEEAWPRNFELAMEVFASKDSIEGATAFAEKRPPRWTGT